MRVLSVDRPALVLGSTQSPPPPSRRLADVEVVRRRSGGGAVVLRPGETVWIDVVVPAGDVLWSDDVGLSFHWLGSAWVEALSALGVEDLAVHRGAMVQTAWSRAVCFAGLGPGEVVTRSAAKVVGMASRRTRDGALFQCAVPLLWDPAAYVELLGLPEAAVDALAVVAAPLAGADAEEVAHALLGALPEP